MDIFEKDIRKIFGQYGEVKDKVSIFRQYAKNKREIRTGNLEYEKSEKKVNNENIYNIVSILGGRGTGKTSILIQLAEDLNKEEDNNIVFPLIEPERISNDDDLLGWVVKLILDEGQKIIKDLDKKIDINSNICCFRKERGDIEFLINNVKKSYFIRKDSYNEIISREYGNKSDYIKETNTRLNAIVELQGSFRKLIDEIVNYKSRDNSEPMLIFMFDDVDICAPLVSKILNLIMNYLSHPNIVTYIAGDYQSFQESISIEFLKSENLLHEDLLHKEVLDDGISIVQRRVDRSYDFLKKVMPSQHRYYINPLSNEKKFDLIFNQLYLVNQNNNKVKETLKDIFSKISIATSKNNKENNERLEFIKYNNEILYDYMCIFDDNLRGMIHVIDFINNNIKKISSKDKEEKLNFINSLLEKIIDSKLSFRDKSRFILKAINIPEGVNFSMIAEKLYDKREKNNRTSEWPRGNIIIKEKDFNLYYEIFLLSNFFHLLMITLGIRSDKNLLEGVGELSSILNLINEDEGSFRLFPKLKDKKALISFKQELFKKMEYSQIRDLFKGDIGYLESLYISSINKLNCIKPYKNIADIFGRILRDDEKWVKGVVNHIKSNRKTEDTILKNIVKELSVKFTYINRIVDLRCTEFSSYKNIENLEPGFSLECLEVPEYIPELYVSDIVNLIDSINSYKLDDDGELYIDKALLLDELLDFPSWEISLSYWDKMDIIINKVIFDILQDVVDEAINDYSLIIEMTIGYFYAPYGNILSDIYTKLRRVKNYIMRNFEDDMIFEKNKLIRLINRMGRSDINNDDLDDIMENIDIYTERMLEYNNKSQAKEITYLRKEITYIKDKLSSSSLNDKKKLAEIALNKILPTYFDARVKLYQSLNSGKISTTILSEINNDIDSYKKNGKSKAFRLYLNEEYKDA